jgi:DNA-binding transcriptional ArsR family regulator
VDGFTRLLWWLLASSAGAASRVTVLRALREEPRNAQQLAVALHLDYSTVRHHLRVLLANRLIESTGPHYGQVYSISTVLDARWADVEHILERKAKR